MIPLNWAISDIKFNKQGDKLVALSLDGIFIYIYSTLNFKNNYLPIQKFCTDNKACKIYNPIDIIELEYK